MGQAELIEFFETHPGRWYTSREISEDIGVGIGSVTTTLRKFRELDLVEYRETRNHGKKYLYKFKR